MAVGRRVAGAVERVMQAGRRGARLDALRDGPAPDEPVTPAEDCACGEQERAVRHHLGFDADTPGLGEYIKAPRNGHDEAVGGKSEYIRFPKFWRTWMERQNPETLGALDVLARRELESRIKRKIWRNARRIAALAGAATLAALQWGADQIAFVKEKGPLLWEGLQWLLGLLQGPRT